MSLLIYTAPIAPRRILARDATRCEIHGRDDFSMKAPLSPIIKYVWFGMEIILLGIHVKNMIPKHA